MCSNVGGNDLPQLSRWQRLYGSHGCQSSDTDQIDHNCTSIADSHDEIDEWLQAVVEHANTEVRRSWLDVGLPCNFLSSDSSFSTTDGDANNLMSQLEQLLEESDACINGNNILTGSFDIGLEVLEEFDDSGCNYAEDYRTTAVAKIDFKSSEPKQAKYDSIEYTQKYRLFHLSKCFKKWRTHSVTMSEYKHTSVKNLIKAVNIQQLVCAFSTWKAKIHNQKSREHQIRKEHERLVLKRSICYWFKYHESIEDDIKHFHFSKRIKIPFTAWLCVINSHIMKARRLYNKRLLHRANQGWKAILHRKYLIISFLGKVESNSEGMAATVINTSTDVGCNDKKSESVHTIQQKEMPTTGIKDNMISECNKENVVLEQSEHVCTPKNKKEDNFLSRQYSPCVQVIAKNVDDHPKRILSVSVRHTHTRSDCKKANSVNRPDHSNSTQRGLARERMVRAQALAKFHFKLTLLKLALRNWTVYVAESQFKIFKANIFCSEKLASRTLRAISIYSIVQKREREEAEVARYQEAYNYYLGNNLRNVLSSWKNILSMKYSLLIQVTRKVHIMAQLRRHFHSWRIVLEQNRVSLIKKQLTMIQIKRIFLFRTSFRAWKTALDIIRREKELENRVQEKLKLVRMWLRE